MTILTGGEPLLRRDILEIVRRASERGLWVVVGTNGVRITENLARRLAEAGARGMSLSLDALEPVATTASGTCGAPGRTRWRARRSCTGRAAFHRADHGGRAQSGRARGDRRLRARAPRARRSGTSISWCRRGAGSSSRTSPRRSTTRCSPRSTGSRGSTTGRMLVNAKCAPHYIKTVLENAAIRANRPRMTNPARRRHPIRTYSGGAGGCPAGTHYMGIRPNGDVTPCPYLPVFAGSFAARASRTCGHPHSCSPASVCAPRSADDAGSAR